MFTYFSIKFNTSIGIEKENVSGSKFRNFDAFFVRGNGKLKL